MGKHSIITPAMAVARIEAEDKRIADEKAIEEFWKLWESVR